MDRKCDLMAITKSLAEMTDRLELVCQEEDDSKDFAEDANYFLKLDGKRLGRDIKLYEFFGNEIMGWERGLVFFLEEVILPLQPQGLTNCYKMGIEALDKLGQQVYTGKKLKEWDDLLQHLSPT